MDYIKVASVCILNDNNEILICKRKSGRLANKFEFPGGKVEPNELIENTCVREIKEELDLNIKVIKYIDSIKYSYQKDIDGFDLNINLSVFLSRIKSGEIKLSDHIEYHFVSYKDLDKYDFSKADRLLFETIKKEVIVELIKCDIKNLFSNDHSGHDYNHTLRVYNNALLLLKDIKWDEFKTKLIALLHDADDKKLFKTVNNENARNILNKYDLLDESIIDDINNISYNGNGKNIPKSIEGKIVQDADRLDALGAIGIARCFEYGGANNRKMYDDNIKPKDYLDEKDYHHNNSTTINHFYEKLFKLKDLMNFEISKKEAVRRTEYMKGFIEEFYKEIK